MRIPKKKMKAMKNKFASSRVEKMTKEELRTYIAQNDGYKKDAALRELAARG